MLILWWFIIVKIQCANLLTSLLLTTNMTFFSAPDLLQPNSSYIAFTTYINRLINFLFDCISLLMRLFVCIFYSKLYILITIRFYKNPMGRKGPQALKSSNCIHKFENFPVCSESASFYCSISPPIKVSNLTTLQQSQTKLVQIL